MSCFVQMTLTMNMSLMQVVYMLRSIAGVQSALHSDPEGGEGNKLILGQAIGKKGGMTPE